MTASPDERVEASLFDQMQRLLQRITASAPAGVVVLVVALWQSVDRVALLAYGSFGVGMCAITYVQVGAGRRAQAAGRGSPRRRYRLLAGNMVLSSWGWGMIAWVAGGRAAWVQAIAGVYVVGYIAANMVFNAPTRTLFHAFQTPLLVTAASGFLWHGGTVGNLLAVVLVVFAGNAVRLHTELHRVFHESAQREFANADLVGQMEAMNARLAHEATHDGLTGLVNRHLFRDHLDRALARAQRRGGAVTVLFLDLDRFKVINDSLGHGAGDDLLTQFAARVASLLRAGDVFARLGGDEFTIMLTDASDVGAAMGVAQRILQACREPFDVAGRHVVSTVSMGAAQNTHAGDGADDLLRQADVALYRAKDLGRNRVELFDASLRADLDRRLDDEIAVRGALAGGEIVPWYQPAVDLATGRIVSVEALARWQHPSDGVLLPGRFLPVLEECGLTGALLTEIVRHAGTAVASLEREGLLADDFRVWINVDPDDSGGTRTPPELVRFARRLGISPARFGAEVTERAVMRDLESSQRMLGELKELGVAIALDDFGTGHSSLALLQTLPVDVVKVDRSFVRDMHEDERDRALVTAIVRLTHDLGIDVVAEGIENDVQERLLLDTGCRVGQGFLFSPAVPAEVLTGWLRDGVPWSARRPSTR